ncbi:hypothetical protein AMATHDRAFT_67885 [Amanita thiersii Skay4041]|uniref:Large ribosomal subunit protein uL2m n=1 Tax=Amanita thiersii Skay4041 TaxID=703135 RepID=A0A2A9NDH0_9AGAR|nr:hypothetical protein AMATHDRAFT_67885 [Amanita thiersii Skay4041]
MLLPLLRSSLRSCASSSSAPLLLRTLPPTTSSTSFLLLRSSSSYSTQSAYSQQSSNQLDAAFARSTALFKTYKPISPGIRHLRRPLNPHLYEGSPVRLLTVAKRKSGGRNAHGKITVRHRGGGHKQRIRIVDFMRDTPGVHDVVRIEYDPGRSAHIALVRNRDASAVGVKKWSYILATEGMRAGDTVQSFRRGIPEGFIPGFDSPKGGQVVEEDGEGEVAVEQLEGQGAEQEGVATAEVNEAEMVENEEEGAPSVDSSQSLALGLLRTLTLKPGNVLPLKLVPPGTMIHNIALKPFGPGKLVRSAGTFAQVTVHEEKGRYVHVRLQSGEVRKVLKDCCATIGKVSNSLWKNRSLGKAGRSRWLGKRPAVRGVAMNACDHPHGGGRGKSKSNKHPVSIWGWGTKGTRTRKPGPKGPKNSNKMVIRERPRGKDKRTSR